MSNSIDDWNIPDVNAAKKLEDILPLSARARSLLVRNRSNPMLKKTGFFNVLGAVEMLEGLEYHHDNIVRITGDLANGAQVADSDINHEAVAYINRLGQFYYFAKSDSVRSAIADVTTLIPTISKFMVFRMKHTAHRSIDAPRGESDDLKIAHARAVSTMMGSILSPKPNAPEIVFPKKYGGPEWEKFQRDLWKYNYRTFQTYDADIESHVNLTIEMEHSAIADEAYSILERVILHE
jgi:hypothetical protein